MLPSSTYIFLFFALSFDLYLFNYYFHHHLLHLLLLLLLLSSLQISGHQDDVSSVKFADESGNILFSAGDDGIVKVWDRRSLKESKPQPVGMLAGHKDGITYIDPKVDD